MSTALTPPPARDYQLTTVDGIRQAFREGHKSVLAVLATGLGKTTVWALVAQLTVQAGNRCFFVAHRSELVKQGRERAELYGLSVGEISTEAVPRYGRPVQAAMIMTLVNHLPVLKPGEMPHIVFVDEAHRAISKTYRKVIADLQAAGARLVGLTATPWRLDKKPMGELFDSIVNTISISDAIARGFLLSPRYYGTEQDLSAIGTKGNDYDAEQLYKRYNKRSLYAGTVTNYENFGLEHPCVCYCINVDHSKNTAEAFIARGIPAAHVDGKTNEGERKQILRDFKAGKYRVLCNADLFTEGLDIPQIGCVILNRATQSLALFIQMVGRGARPIAGQTAATDEARVAAIQASQKPHFICIDQGENLKTHGFWEDEREYSLEAPAKKKKKGGGVDASPIKFCPSCGLINKAQVRTCLDCSYEWPLIAKEAKEGVFMEIIRPVRTVAGLPVSGPVQSKTYKAIPPDLQDVSDYDWSQQDFVRVGKLSGYSKGWLKHNRVYQRLYGGAQEQVA